MPVTQLRSTATSGAINTAGSGALNFGNTGGVSAVRQVIGTDATPGAAASAAKATVTKLAVANNTATAVLTVTVPNAAHSGGLELTLISSNGPDRAYESTRVAKGLIAITRVAGANVVAVAATLALAQIATSAAGATHTLAYAVSAVTGAVGAVNTFDVTVTIVGTGGTPATHQVMATYELHNLLASGITVAAAA